MEPASTSSRLAPNAVNYAGFVGRSPSRVIPMPGSRICQRKYRSVAVNAGCKLLGVGSSVPETVLTNADLERIVETSDEWITRRTGIRQRHVLSDGELLADHATTASERALEMAGVSAEDLDLIIMGTSSPDDIFGSACQVQNRVGAGKAVAFDITAACSGFVVSLITAAQYIRTGAYKNVLVVGGDALSRVVDWKDRSTCILFGDACGAVVMSADDSSSESDGLLGMAMNSTGSGQKNLHAMFNSNGCKPLGDDDVQSAKASFCNLEMNGKEVFKWAVRGVPAVIEEALESGGLDSDALDWLVMHQANQRILDAAADRLGLDSKQVVSNLSKYGNTSAASIPLALDEAVREGQVKSGDVVAMAGFGAGLTMAAAIVKWG
ncbi:hypothetical protein BSKO_13165 [Bryopsis sp. KO-2023]|nr:hypothetical protein BSKO_13165 [Bryopsis sp. KO-2023]